ncbi:MAG: B12-binding domain-containing radical SAM protein [Candidatus Omnitrophica bacterium]|nr:B12-binding domain-containing radical SAM protein [Candidatus Omnitrophota bacterium]MBU1924483.1 B12-binding domain-containing radical SAM protein [Candidatus Omnitrophota bacterium]
MKTLLIIPTVDTCYERVPSMGLMNLYLIGKKLGHDMTLLDLTEFSYSKGLKEILLNKYDFIGISCNFTNAAPYCMKYAKDIKAKYPDTLVIAGGNHATLVPEDLLGNGYDYIVCGEGEITFEEFLKTDLDRQKIETLEGIAYLNDGEIVKTSGRQQIQNLDELPFNDYAEFNLEPYFKRSGLRYISMETSRGCIYNCAFCSTVRMWGHVYRCKSPQRVLSEFKIAKKLNLDFVFIEDDDVALDENNLREFCNLLIKEKINQPWGSTVGSKSIKQESTFDLMAESGCIKVNICIESANPRILKAYRKPYTIEDNRKTCFNLRKRDILVHNHGIIGAPDETLWESLKTYFYLIRTSPIWHISILEPRPGSDYWKKWSGRGDVAQYKLFGKANVVLGGRKSITYLIYRIFALFYFLNPTRIFRAVFSKDKGKRYSYLVQYHVAGLTLKQNLKNFIKRPLQ